MSIILALRSKYACIVAGDSQRLSSEGRSEAPYDKTFVVHRGLIGAYAGLLEVSGWQIREHIQEAFAGSFPNAEDAAALFANYISRCLMNEELVSFEHRRLDVLFASPEGVSGVGFFPDRQLQYIQARVVSESWLVTGSPISHMIALGFLNNRLNAGGTGGPTRNMVWSLRNIASDALSEAIAFCGPDTNHPAHPSCCLPIVVRSIPDL